MCVFTNERTLKYINYETMQIFNNFRSSTMLAIFKLSGIFYLYMYHKSAFHIEQLN